MIFKSSPNKDLIRRDVDLDLVKQFHESKAERLAYFGLPGTELLDISEWRDYLGSYTCVERSEPLLVHLLLDNAFYKGLDKDLQLMVGDIDEIMLSWKDDCGCSPRAEAFDIVNLDYVGGLLYKDFKGKSTRLSAIKNLISRQAEKQRDFLFMLTVNARSRDVREIDLVLSQIQDELKGYRIDSSRAISWYKKQPYQVKLKLYVPYVLDAVGAAYGFVSKFHPPIIYEGTGGAKMAHFAFSMEYQKKIAGKAKAGSLVNLVNLDILQVRNSRISLYAKLPSL